MAPEDYRMAPEFRHRCHLATNHCLLVAFYPPEQYPCHRERIREALGNGWPFRGYNA